MAAPTLAAVAALAAACSANAQSQTPGTPSLPETVVTATRNSQPLSAVTQHTTVITRAEIEQSQASDLVTLLQREAGLQRTQNGGVGTVSSVFMRGAPSLETLVLIDGVPLNKQDASGAVSLEHVMLDNVERVEVVRGNVSAVYGSGAIGGVIQIFTRGGTSVPSGHVTLEAGPRAWRKVAAQASGTVGATSISAGASRLQTDGYSSINTTQQPGANADADGYKNTSYNLALTQQLAPRHQLGLRASGSEGDSQYDNAFGAPTDLQTSNTTMRQMSLFADDTWGNWRSRVTLSQQSDTGEFDDNGFFGSSDRFETRATIFNWVNTLALGDDWLLTAGLERQRQSVETASSSVYSTPYDVSRNTTAVFGGLEGAVGVGNLQLNVRHDKVGEDGKSTGYLGYSLPLGEAVKLVASTSTAFNAAPLGYLYAPGYGNPDLTPETAKSHELGLQFEAAGQFMRATWFSTRVKNQLDYDRTTYAFANIGRTRNQGVEVSYHGTLGSTQLRASLTLQNPKNDLTDEALARRAKTLWSVGATQAMGDLSIDADLRGSGQRADRYTDVATFSTVETTLPSYTVLDLAFAYKLRPDLALRARIDNVTDKTYQTVYAYNQQPRSLYVGLSWSPKF